MTDPIRPTETDTWTRCPQLWAYKYVDGWRPAEERFSVEMAMGSAVHAGLAAHWKGLPPVKVAQDALAVGWPEGQELALVLNQELLASVVAGAVAWVETFMVGARPVQVEQALEPDGHTTPDLVTDEEGEYVLTDYKYSHNCDPAHVHFRLDGVERAHQFRHYAWALGEIGFPIAMIRKLVIVGQPKVLVREATYRPTPESQAEWLRQAKVKWHTMHKMRAGHGLVYRREDGCKPYGEKYPCPMWEACWTCHGDEAQMAHFYIREKGSRP